MKEKSRKGDFERHTRWAPTCDYYDGESKVVIHFSGTILRYLVGMENGYTWYRLRAIRNLKSEYAIKLLEICAQWRDQGRSQVYTLERLRERFGVVDSYPTWADLKRYVIEKAVKEVNDRSDMSVSYEIQKQGRSVVSVVFYPKAKYQDDLFGPKPM